MKIAQIDCVDQTFDKFSKEYFTNFHLELTQPPNSNEFVMVFVLFSRFLSSIRSTVVL